MISVAVPENTVNFYFTLWLIVYRYLADHNILEKDFIFQTYDQWVYSKLRKKEDSIAQYHFCEH